MNLRFSILILLLLFLVINCAASEKNKVLDHEGVSKSELKSQLGNNESYNEKKSLSLEDIMDEVTNNVSEEYCTCSAYFMIVSEGLKRSKKPEIAQQYIVVSEKASNAAFELAKQSRTSEMAGKVTAARIEFNTKEMIGEINNNIENISILMNKYGSHCKNIMKDPDTIMYEWTNKIMNKYMEK